YSLALDCALCPHLTYRPALGGFRVYTELLLLVWRDQAVLLFFLFFFFEQKTAYELGLGIPAEPLFRSPYGYSMPIAVRYTQDAFSRSGWLWPVDAKGEPLKATSYMAVGFYVAKYVNKKSDMDLAAKG